MKQQQLSNTDWQLLSEYLDGQISARDKAALEKRLQTQEELRAGLDELRQTRALLRSVSKQRVPRNFTLTAAMVEKVRPRPWLRLIPALNFTSAAAALAVIVVMVVNFLPGAMPAAAPAAPAASDAPSIMAAESQPEVALTPAPMGGTPVIIQWGGGLGGGGGMGGDTVSAAPEMQAMPQSEVARDFKGAPGAEPLPPQSGLEMAAPALTATPEQQTFAAAPFEGSGPIMGVVPAEEAQAYNAQQIQDAAAESATSSVESQPAPDGWAIPTAVGLGVLALGAGITAYMLRRKAAA